MTDWTSHAGRLADVLDNQGAIRDPAWREVFARTPGMSQADELVAAGARGSQVIPELRQPAFATTTGVDRQAWDDPDFQLWLSLHQPDASVAERFDPSGDRRGVTVYTSSDRAILDYVSEHGTPPSQVVIHGRTRPWNTVEAAWSGWLRHGGPARTRIGITAARDEEQYAWLDHPDGPLRWPLALPQSRPDD